jgi:hypothetical protein
MFFNQKTKQKVSSMLLNDFFTSFFPSQRETGRQGERLKPGLKP